MGLEPLLVGTKKFWLGEKRVHLRSKLNTWGRDGGLGINRVGSPLQNH